MQSELILDGRFPGRIAGADVDAAVNAFTKSLAHELAPFSVRVRLVLPGRAPGTSFGENARRFMSDRVPDAYADVTDRVFAS